MKLFQSLPISDKSLSQRRTLLHNLDSDNLSKPFQVSLMRLLYIAIQHMEILGISVKVLQRLWEVKQLINKPFIKVQQTSLHCSQLLNLLRLSENKLQAFQRNETLVLTQQNQSLEAQVQWDNESSEIPGSPKIFTLSISTDRMEWTKSHQQQIFLQRSTIQ